MLRHHVDVYDSLKRKFPDAEVIFGTSDKVEDGSPFNFKEKQAIAMAHGIDPSNVVEARSPYVHTFYKDSYNFDDYYVFFAVGEKDIKERFAMNNIDPDTGLDMKIKPNKETGEKEAKYYQMINTYNKDNPKPMSERGYLFQVDNIEVEGEVASASAFRSALKNAPDKEAAKEVFKQQFSDYKENIFELVYNKIVGEKMSEDLNILMKLAGLEIKEGAPVEFESEVNVKDIEFTPPSKSSSFHSIANRFPDGSDVNDPDVKKEEFIQALLKSPASLLSEINERISPSDDNGLEASEKVNKIINQVEKEDGGIAKLNDDDKKFTLELVKKAIKEMELSAGDDTPAYDEEPEMPEESVNLSDIRSDYGVQEDEDGVYANHVTYVGPNGDKLGTEDCDGELDPDMMAQMASDEECKMLCDKHNMDYNDTVGCLKFNDGEATMQDGEELPDGTIAFYGGKDGSIEEAEVDEGRMSDIHQDANEMDKEEFAKAHPMFADDWEGMQHQDDPDEPSQDEIDANYTIVKKYIGKKKDESVEESSEDSGEGPISSMSDEELMDYVGQREEDIVDDIQQHIAPDFLHKENYEEMFEKYREEVLEPAAEEISQDKAMDQMPDEMEMDAEESIEDTSGKALEAAMSELKKLAGLNEEDKKEFDKSGCMAEMKKLYANHCTKESMYSKLNAEYNCNRKQFEELYASHCG